MTFRYDPVIAAAHGYEVRTDDDGYAYAVPAGTPKGSMRGATPPAPTAAVHEGAADVTVTGDCGTASLTFTSKSHFTTSYVIFPQWGFALSHTWHVAVHSSIDAASFNLDGAAPPLSQGWQGERDIDVQALSGQLLSGVAGGTTTTVLGECVAASPTDSIVY
ncbi:hypothetical protein B7R25_04020 [Subtercola boreus]|uniref:Uncharacterized protein n=2 Tax=Subtercola boreus TaxID=120213 RepID=A0A3E0WD98_9MICO|nr:hypothetical protein B7R25_04020 [Subtercola boreus]